jgi:type IV secretory pathway VirB4 component
MRHRLSAYVRSQDHVANDTVLLPDAAVMTMISIDGQPFDTVDDEVINRRDNQLEFAILDLVRSAG